MDETFTDRLLGFSLPLRNARGRIVRLDGVLDEILDAHDYPPAITHLLGEALVLGTLMGGLLKDEASQMTMQAQTKEGIVRLLVCDYRAGELRGYADFDAGKLTDLGANPSLKSLFGGGYLAITFDVGDDRGRYQGIVPLEGESLSEACQNYFVQSEQVPTLIRTAVSNGPDGRSAAGLIIQHLADGEEGRERLHVRLDHPEWDHVQILGGSVRHDELLGDALSLEAIVWRLFHEEDEIRIQPGSAITRGCRCSVEHYAQVLGKFGTAELDEMRDEDGQIIVDCAFCSRLFNVEPAAASPA